MEAWSSWLWHAVGTAVRLSWLGLWRVRCGWHAVGTVVRLACLWRGGVAGMVGMRLSRWCGWHGWHAFGVEMWLACRWHGGAAGMVGMPLARGCGWHGLHAIGTELRLACPYSFIVFKWVPRLSTSLPRIPQKHTKTSPILARPKKAQNG
ncbi:hypothetical protein C5167_036370 [Papaver somniferum]|uniref:Uncharacterized protein n=1 Tax=Papaver somniferum TaxID=3469 RepID=A0A4Y7I6F0_PAPSO|nr:hypothetical protein C5167_036370 [Papaver somniferum]